MTDTPIASHFLDFRHLRQPMPASGQLARLQPFSTRQVLPLILADTAFRQLARYAYADNELRGFRAIFQIDEISAYEMKGQDGTHIAFRLKLPHKKLSCFLRG